MATRKATRKAVRSVKPRKPAARKPARSRKSSSVIETVKSIVRRVSGTKRRKAS